MKQEIFDLADLLADVAVSIIHKNNILEKQTTCTTPESMPDIQPRISPRRQSKTRSEDVATPLRQRGC